MFNLFDLGKANSSIDEDSFKNEIANICRKSLTDLYEYLEKMDVIECGELNEYDVEEKDAGNISEEELLIILNNIYLLDYNSMLKELESLANYVFSSKKQIELDNENAKEITTVLNAESYYFIKRSKELIIKNIEKLEEELCE